MKILVVGGGVGGMTAAIQLGRGGHAVVLAEIDPGWRAAGAGLTLNGATLRAFGQLGVLDEVRREGHIHGGRRVHHHDGSLIADIPAYVPEADDMQAGGGILRPALHGILSRTVRSAGVDVRLGLSVTSFEQSDDEVVVRLSDHSVETFDAVIGADGIQSSTRKLVMPDAAVPRFTGQGAWRAVFDRPQDVSTTHLFIDPGFKLGLNPVSETQMYMFLLESAPGNPWRPEETWHRELGDRLASFGGLPRDLASALSEESLINYRPLETLLLPLPWHVGRVVLLGDAVHATTPHAGYGAGLSIEDGLVLAEYLNALPVDEAIRAYEQRRFERCREVLDGSLALGRLEMARAPLAEQQIASTALYAGTLKPF